VVFGPTPRDLHPDHRATAREVDIACCWASSEIWLEKGSPIPPPKRYDYAVYCTFPSPPDLQIKGTPAQLKTKLAALEAFHSQGCITEMVSRLEKDGPIEYLKDATWQPYRPSQYEKLFE